MFSKGLLASSVLALSFTQTVLAAGVKYAGVNIAGFDFGCSTDGTCKPSSVDGPITTATKGSSGDGAGQMSHFVTKDKLNIFRLPVAWQFLVNSKLGGTLDATNLASYDKLMQSCLTTGAYCIIDIHNYARWNGQIIGSSGGPTNDDFSGLWKQLATKYAAEEKVVMGLMNEPHDMPDLASWAGSVQAAVTAIRGAGASSQMILLPGNGYTGAATFVSGGSAAALAGVTNPDGSTDNLVFDVHQYLDSDGSGTTASCVKTSDVFAPLLTWLKDSKRQALLSETGGGSDDASCITNVCEVLDFLNTNSDQFLGYVGWAAGSFASSYVLSLVPDGDTDVPLMEKCFAAKFGGGAGTAPASPVSSSPATAPTTSAAVVAPSSTSAAVIAPSSSASSPAPVVPSSSAPAPIAPTSTPASPPIATSAPVLVQPPKPTSTTTPPYGLGPQKPGGTTTTSSPSEAGDEQDDCEAEFEDVLAVRTVVSRNGRARLRYEDEI